MHRLALPSTPDGTRTAGRVGTAWKASTATDHSDAEVLPPGLGSLRSKWIRRWACQACLSRKIAAGDDEAYARFACWEPYEADTGTYQWPYQIMAVRPCIESCPEITKPQTEGRNMFSLSVVAGSMLLCLDVGGLHDPQGVDTQHKATTVVLLHLLFDTMFITPPCAPTGNPK